MEAKRPRSRDERVGDWRLIDLLGKGGQGEVWKVRHATERHTPVGALKLLRGEDAQALARFAREIRLLREANHPGVVRVRDAGEHRGAPYFVMEYANTTLEKVITSDQPGARIMRDSPALLLRFFGQFCAAVAALHRNGVLHRDIKPSNLLLMLEPPEPMRAIVADFGIAAAFSEQGTLTNTHELVGSPAFRAPEAYQRNALTAASDVYSLGKVLEFIFTRCVPPEPGPGRCLRSEALSSDLWNRLDGVLARACAFSRADRYPDAEALLAALPDVVLVEAASVGRATATAGVPDLGPAEAAVLHALIGACPSTSDSVTARVLRSTADVSEFAFSMALRRLQAVGFADAVLQSDEYGNEWEGYTPSEAAIEWAHTHPHAMPLGASSKEPTDDDIPF